MAVVRNGDYWYFEWKIKGEKVRRSSGCKVGDTTREEVRSLEPKAKADFLSERDHQAGTNPQVEEKERLLLSEAIDRFYQERWSKLRKSEAPRIMCEKILDILGDKYLDTITSEDLRQVKKALFEQGLKGSTVNRYTSALMAILNHAHRYWEILDRVPAVRREDESDNVRVRVVSWEEEKAILQACDELGLKDFKDFYIVLVDTGLRKSEALNLSYMRNIDLDRSTVTIWSQEHKNKAAKEVPLSKRAREVLRRRRIKGPQPFACFTPDMPLYRLQKVLQAAGLQPEGDIVLHTLRHTFASRLLRAGVNIYQVSKLLGHKSVQTTERVYGHMVTEALRPAVSVLDAEVQTAFQ